jgi:hypothetical protein
LVQASALQCPKLMGRDQNSGREAARSGLLNNFMNIFITKSDSIDKCIKIIIVVDVIAVTQ